MTPDQLPLDFSAAETVQIEMLSPSVKVLDLAAARRSKQQASLTNVHREIVESVKHVRLDRAGGDLEESALLRG